MCNCFSAVVSIACWPQGTNRVGQRMRVGPYSTGQWLTVPGCLSWMQGETLRVFGHTINSETRLVVIRLYTAHADAKHRSLCTRWAATADAQAGQIPWKTTDNIHR